MKTEHSYILTVFIKCGMIMKECKENEWEGMSYGEGKED